MWFTGVGFERVRKGGSRVLTPDLVVMEKVGASGLRVSLFLIAERIFENCSCISLCCWSSISPIPFVWDFFSSIKLVALPSKWKKRSWMVTGRPTDHLGIGCILQFDSTPLLWFWKRIQALLMDSSSPCLNQRIKSLRDEVHPAGKK
ncbi:hypothetical protein Tco_1436357 [Tanacetum coccineum]